MLALYYQLSFLIILCVASWLCYGRGEVMDEKIVVPLTHYILAMAGPFGGGLAALGTFFLLSRCRLRGSLPCVLFLCLPALLLGGTFSALLLMLTCRA